MTTRLAHFGGSPERPAHRSGVARLTGSADSADWVLAADGPTGFGSSVRSVDANDSNPPTADLWTSRWKLDRWAGGLGC